MGGLHIKVLNTGDDRRNPVPWPRERNVHRLLPLRYEQNKTKQSILPNLHIQLGARRSRPVTTRIPEPEYLATVWDGVAKGSREDIPEGAPRPHSQPYLQQLWGSRSGRWTGKNRCVLGRGAWGRGAASGLFGEV